MITTTLGLLAFQYVGIPYRWGGQDCNGFDCSGLIIRTLRDAGVKIEDKTAAQLLHWAKEKGLRSCEPEEDCLLFFGGDRITHIALAVGSNYMIEAGGAGRESVDMTDKELLARDARVRLARIDSRQDLVRSIKLGLRLKL